MNNKINFYTVLFCLFTATQNVTAMDRFGNSSGSGTENPLRSSKPLTIMTNSDNSSSSLYCIHNTTKSIHRISPDGSISNNIILNTEPILNHRPFPNEKKLENAIASLSKDQKKNISILAEGNHFSFCIQAGTQHNSIPTHKLLTTKKSSHVPHV